ncbi:hypothetical protein F2Q68_00039686 [Brassica cretica]|uniref:Uncharacterized protein n=1 Tax=Brassica cretica TaxID=69181 RepID=A0A8S9MLE9_BRACR|nr:hypothetical protein F2Q68_00039686 [Brassica cretica]
MQKSDPPDRGRRTRGEEDQNVNRLPRYNFSSRLPRSPPSSTTATESSFTIHNLLR